MKLTIAIIVATAALAVSLLGTQASFAQTNTANTLKVSPVRTDVTIQAGETKKVQTVVTNLTKSPITVRPVENDFVSADENGTPGLILDENKYAPTHSLKRFMTPLADVTIPGGQAKVVDVEISVPEDAQPGGYYGAVRFAPTSPDDGGQVNLSASVASLILLTVPGDVVEKLDLTEFNIQQNGKSSGYFTSSNDLQAAFRFQNKGGIQLGPFGKITVKQGNKVVYEADFNNKDQRDMVLTDSARRWEVPLKNIGSFGNYTVSATFTYGKSNQTVEVTRSFWVVPQIAIIAAVVILILLIALIAGGIWLVVRNRKKRVLRSHNRRSGGLKKL
ncbi:DUF916 domain-containing protein [Candidatus Saccharibacteria bacterium]|nr:DUF916 domain-containing protein [Candidatus Saccharibacteria bacterium]MBH1973302.1 DUF916 domain-containing protein [Candidatus Saccharibacteria bacterium]MBH1990457.1 DUF916 domain-containing protein [Candidatus Saccharibacteria bacterium]